MDIKKELCDSALKYYKELVEEKGEFHPVIFMALVYFRMISQDEEDHNLIERSLKELKEKGILYLKEQKSKSEK